MIERIAPYLIVFLASLVVTLVLTPIVREINRRLGMVDKPDPRRINKVPIPRGGGLAIFLSVMGTFAAYMVLSGGDAMLTGGSDRFWKLAALSAMLVAIGYVDDKISLKPKVKLLGQILVAVLTWLWADVGFNDLWPELPVWLDCVLTVCWIIGAVNAFNLIDGMDGLASGLALIATLGMVGGLFFAGRFGGTLFYFAFAGGLVGFLRYNYNPASVFLGDSGSMYLGFTLAVLPLCSHAANSFLVSVGVPLLAMGVPIFDTSLAILRRSIRHLLIKEGAASAGNDRVMTADTDHLHHRILRAAGLNQRKAAWVLYAMAGFLVLIGLVGISLETRAGGLWLAAVAVAAVVVFRDMARIELLDAGALLAKVAHTRDVSTRRRWARLAVPAMLVLDVAIFVLAVLAVAHILKLPFTMRHAKTALPIRVATMFGAFVFFRAYVTIWSRAVLSNYVRLLLAVFLGTIAGAVLIYYIPGVPASQQKAFAALYAAFVFTGTLCIRFLRPFIRDTFYVLDCRRMIGRKDVSRILVYGSGLRYKAFRRELVRTTAANSRMIVGLIDDDILLRNRYIGGIKVRGTLAEAPEIINELNVSEVVVACEVTPDWLKIIKKTLAPCGVKITQFTFSEQEL